MIRSLACSMLLGLVFTSAPAAADPLRENMQFYPKNYVTKPKQETPPVKSVIPGREQPSKGAAPLVRPAISESRTTAAAPGAPKTENILDEAAGKPIRSISALLSTANPDSLRDNLAQLGDAASRLGISPGLLYLVGPLIDPGDYIEGTGTFAPLFAAGALPISVQEVPKQYPVTLSPTWIVETDQGTILLEGVTHLERYVNGRGEFVDRSLAFQPNKITLPSGALLRAASPQGRDSAPGSEDSHKSTGDSKMPGPLSGLNRS